MALANLRQGITVAMANASSVSPSAQLNADAARVMNLLIVTPSTLTGNPLAVQHSLDGSTWRDLAIHGVSSKVLVSQGAANIINGVPGIGYIRFTGTTTQTAALSITVLGLANAVN